MAGNPGASTGSAGTLLLVVVAKTNQERGGILALSGASDLLHIYAQTHREQCDLHFSQIELVVAIYISGSLFLGVWSSD